MDCCALKIAPFTSLPTCSSLNLNFSNRVCYGSLKLKPICAVSQNGSVSSSNEAESTAVKDAHRQRSSLESLFCYDKPVPEERIDEPVGIIALAEKAIGDNPRCADCEAKGAVLCATCSGTGLYVDSILESQGIIVKVVADPGISCVETVADEVILDASDYV
ncbi:hypothetical protein ACFE04_028329 [Oxalis oulophora]